MLVIFSWFSLQTQHIEAQRANKSTCVDMTSTLMTDRGHVAERFPDHLLRTGAECVHAHTIYVVRPASLGTVGETS